MQDEKSPSSEEDLQTSSSSTLSENSQQRQRREEEDEEERGSNSVLLKTWRRAYHILSWTPPNVRWDPENPPRFSMGLNCLFAFAGAFTVANLYYSHPILNILADDFGVRDEEAAQIPTVMQAGYAAGLLFLCPLGDLLPRRPFTLWLIFFTATLWVGLCVTDSLAVFTAISFITSVTTVTPQIMLPLVGDLAPPKKRATALSLVVSGFIMGILIARLLSGTLTDFVSWRAIYWLSFGLQYLIFALMWLFMPDYPRTNTGISYFELLWSIVTMLGKHPVLVQSCLVAIFTAATFTSFWTTLTFLLAGAPYNFSPVIIGLFALLGLVPFVLSPLFARSITDKFVPLFSVILGESICLVGVIVGTYTGTFVIAGPVIQAIFNDAGLQIAQVANRSAIYAVEPKGRNRVNTAFMVATFIGQLTGTAAGNHIYARGGWIASGSTSVGFIGMALLLCAARGPHEKGWVGWGGGWSIRQLKDESGPTIGRGAVPEGQGQGHGQGQDEEKAGGQESHAIEEALDEMAAEETSRKHVRKESDQPDEKLDLETMDREARIDKL